MKTYDEDIEIYFKVNRLKLNKIDVLDRQINKICERLIKTHNLWNGHFEIMFGRDYDNFVKNTTTLRITYVQEINKKQIFNNYKNK